MVIATEFADIDTIINLADNQTLLIEYINSFIPDELKHIDAIRNNSRYYMATVIQNKIADIKVRDNVIAKLLKDVRVFGYMGEFIPLSVILNSIDRDKVNEYLQNMDI